MGYATAEMAIDAGRRGRDRGARRRQARAGRAGAAGAGRARGALAGAAGRGPPGGRQLPRRLRAVRPPGAAGLDREADPLRRPHRRQRARSRSRASSGGRSGPPSTPGRTCAGAAASCSSPASRPSARSRATSWAPASTARSTRRRARWRSSSPSSACRVNTIAPGLCDTPLNDILHAHDKEERYATLRPAPAGRPDRPRRGLRAGRHVPDVQRLRHRAGARHRRRPGGHGLARGAQDQVDPPRSRRGHRSLGQARWGSTRQPHPASLDRARAPERAGEACRSSSTRRPRPV